jgi:cytochrome c biogenesis protein CcmG/thiol:disulfide interchange protein DsbE
MRLFIGRRWSLVSISILAVGALWIWLSMVPPGSMTQGVIPAPQEGFYAPEFELTTLNGEEVALSDLRGKAVLVNFWATWCPPCRTEMPAMQRVYDDYSRGEFVVLAVNTTYQDRSADVVDFVAEQGLKFPILLDNTGAVSNRYQIRSMPTSFFIDPDGLISEIVIGGPMSEALLRTRVDRLLEQ